MAGGLAPVDRQAALALVVVELVCAVLLLFGSHLPTAAITGTAAALLAPANTTLRWMQSVATARSDASRLSREVAQLRIERDRMIDAGLENARLRALLGFTERGRPSLRPVQVAGVAGEPWPVIFHLTGGSADGLAVGQAVLAPEGLVGRLIRVDARSSSATLITDPNAPVACEVVGTGVRGVLKFRFGPDPGLYLTAVPLTDTVRVGERIVTSATSLLFPPGIPVGRVTRVGREPTGLLSAIRVEPFAPLSRVREVLVAVGPIEPAWWPKPASPDSAKAAARADSARAAVVRPDSAHTDSTRGRAPAGGH
jgi:rod shape-determining protein MreC